MKEEGLQASKKPEVEKNFFGLVVQNITPDIAKHLNLKDKRGVIVTDVQPGSPAQNADVRSGDVIKEIGRRPVKNLTDFKEAMKKANAKEGVVMLIARENATFYAVMRE
jgi:serine protease Do